MLVWFRNDLRLDDNPAFINAYQQGCRKAVFFNTPKQWAEHHWSAIKIDFVQRHLGLLQSQLADLGVEFNIHTVDDFSQQNQALMALCQEQGISQVYANREIEFNERQRDEQLLSAGLNLTLFNADTVVADGVVTTKQGEMYRVFTPFFRAWIRHLQEVPNHPQALDLDTFTADESSDGNDRPSAKWPLADLMLADVLPQFIHHKIHDYQTSRDFPALKGTSGLSPYLATGAISPKRVLQQVLAIYPDALHVEQPGVSSWLRELAWRDFYRHLLNTFPHLSKDKCFKPSYDGLLWPERRLQFQLWCEGKTGFPIVDAAMRQLLKTGWMHNRLRMIVASFLTKNLLVNWRLGERFFMSHLIDGDLAANNGGWQWCAGTGCDAQPYFRVFNPVCQSKKFDPTATFIRKYLPELKNVPDKHIHEPYQFLMEQGLQDTYWPPMVDLKQSRLDAIAFYKQ